MVVVLRGEISLVVVVFFAGVIAPMLPGHRSFYRLYKYKVSPRR